MYRDFYTLDTRKNQKVCNSLPITYSHNLVAFPGKELGAEFVPFDTLVKDSDFVIISCPLTEETTDLFNASVFGKMKKTAVLVNVARGEVVKQEDLVEALRNRTIFAAGLDVTTPEPLPIDHELLKLENCGEHPDLSASFQ